MNTTTHPYRAPRSARPASLPADPVGALPLAATWFGFALFVVANLLLYTRPTEYLDDAIVGQRAYLVVILATLFFAFPAVLALCEASQLARRPLVALVLLIWPVAILSNVVRGEFEKSAEAITEFGKAVCYYLLFVSLVTTPRRLRWMLFWVTWCAAVLALIAILQYHGVIRLSLMKQLVENEHVRLQATGLFQDPNELGVLLAGAIICCFYFASTPRPGAHSLAYLGLIALFGYALLLTLSRGALLALGGGLFILLRARIGTMASVVLAVMALPSLLLLSGRSVAIGNQSDTATTRLQLWNDALVAFNQNPLIGVGYNNLREWISQVAHNSFLHAFAELGFVGGCLFLGVFAYALWTLLILPTNRRVLTNPELRGLYNTVTGVYVTYLVGMASLSLCYVTPTYTMLGLAAAFIHMATTRPPYQPVRVNERLFLWLGVLGVGFWCVMKAIMMVVPRG